MNIEEEIKVCIDNYIKARRQLLDIGNKYPELIGGNDNIIGRIGEFYGLTFLKSIGQSPIKVSISSNQGFDFFDKITERRTQVKVITRENRNGRSVRLAEPWDQLLLLILDDSYNIERLGYIDKDNFNIALSENALWSKTPIVKVTMLGNDGLIGRYGKVVLKPQLFE